MKRINLMLIVFLFCISFFSYGKEINNKIAKKVAVNAFLLNVLQSNLDIKVTEIIPIVENHKTILYIFNFENGHIVISGDNIAEPILGYGHNKIDFNNIPPGIVFLLENYKEQILYAQHINSKQSEEINNKWDYYLNLNVSKSLKSYIPNTYLIETKWGQQGQYQQYCPIDPNTGIRSLVGCGGVALGQILRYWSCQVSPQGTITYTPSGFSSSITVNFSNQYNCWNTALLLYHSAVALRSDFGSNSTSSNPFQAQIALQTYFGFNADYENKNSHSNTEWINMLKTNINLGQPIFYGGYNQAMTSSGHGWVIDGYKSNNTFHCNWGWEGYADSWYLLGDLTPDSHNYSYNQVAVLDVYPIDCSNVNITNTTFNNNASYNGCSITVKNCTVQNEAKLTLDANCITTLNGTFEVKIGSTLEVK